MNRTVVIAALLAAVAAVPRAAHADRRYYGETYNAATAPKGSLDLELWSTLHRPPSESKGAPRVLRHQVELETGITDRWDVAIYNIARQVGRGDLAKGSDLEYEAAKLETRYRLSEPGRWFVDPVLYLEVKKTFVEDRPFSVEEKVILGKDLGRLNLSLNVAAEQEFAGGKMENEGEWAFGTSWEVIPVLRVGAEAFGTIAEEEGEGAKDKLESLVWAGPAVSLAVGRWWLVLAAGFGLTDASEALRARAIMAFQF